MRPLRATAEVGMPLVSGPVHHTSPRSGNPAWHRTGACTCSGANDWSSSDQLWQRPADTMASTVVGETVDELRAERLLLSVAEAAELSGSPVPSPTSSSSPASFPR